jgi:DNA-binding response OmpR family regulator
MAEVLVIENNKKLADQLAKDLRLAGFRVDSAVGFNEGTAKLCHHKYQVIVMNPFFCDGSADDLLEILRKENMLSRVLVCSADQERVKRSIEQGILAVSKPITPLLLGQLIRHIASTAQVPA